MDDGRHAEGHPQIGGGTALGRAALLLAQRRVEQAPLGAYLSETYLSDVEKLFIVRLYDTMCSSENGSVEPFVGARARLCRQKDIVRRCEIALLRHDSPPDDPHAGSSVHSHDTEKLTQSAPTQRNRATPEKPDQPRSGPNCAVSGRAASSRRAAARTRTADHQSAPPQLRENRTTVGALGRPVSLHCRQLAQEALALHRQIVAPRIQ